MALNVRRFSRKTKGKNAQVIVAKAINYTTQGTYVLFQANAALGEIGVFNADTNALITTLMTGTQKFFIAQKRTSGVFKTNTLDFSKIAAKKTLYVAPVLQSSYIGWNGTSGGLNTLTTNPSYKDEFALAIKETSEGTFPEPTWDYNYVATSSLDVADANVTVSAKLVAAINSPSNPLYKNMRMLVSAELLLKGTYSAFTLTGTTPTMTFTNGSTIATLGGTTPAFNGAIGDLLAFNASATPDQTNSNAYIIKGVSAGVSITLDRPFEGATVTLTQAQVQGTRLNKVTAVTAVGIHLTSLEADSTFKVLARNNFGNADVTYSAYTRGNGQDYQVQALELEGQTFAGDTAKNTQFSSFYGQQDTFVVSGETYDYTNIDFTLDFPTVMSEDQGVHKGFVVICSPKSGGNNQSNMNTIFGV